jgi:hypothetical protein
MHTSSAVGSNLALMPRCILRAADSCTLLTYHVRHHRVRHQPLESSVCHEALGRLHQSRVVQHARDIWHPSTTTASATHATHPTEQVGHTTHAAHSAHTSHTITTTTARTRNFIQSAIISLVGGDAGLGRGEVRPEPSVVRVDLQTPTVGVRGGAVLT